MAELTNAQKTVKVLRSQGYAPILLTNCTQDAADELAAMYGAKDMPAQFADWLDRHLKATVDKANEAASTPSPASETDEPTELETPTITKAVSTDDDGA